MNDQHRAVIDFERTWWQLPGTKTTEIRSRFRCSSSSYYRKLVAAVTAPAAETYDPLTVRRVWRRMRQHR